MYHQNCDGICDYWIDWNSTLSVTVVEQMLDDVHQIATSLPIWITSKAFSQNQKLMFQF